VRTGLVAVRKGLVLNFGVGHGGTLRAIEAQAAGPACGPS
jgi:hypothetical protein